MRTTKVAEVLGTVRRMVRGARRRGGEAGMATAEYAIGTLGAAGIAGLLLSLLTGGGVKDLLMSLVKRALSID